MASQIQTLRNQTQAAIRAYNMQRATLVKEAAAAGGADAVAALEDEFVALTNAAYALQRAKLKRNHRRYRELLAEATDGVAAARGLMTGAASASALLDALGKAVTIVGRALLILGAQ